MTFIEALTAFTTAVVNRTDQAAIDQATEDLATCVSEHITASVAAAVAKPEVVA